MSRSIEHDDVVGYQAVFPDRDAFADHEAGVVSNNRAVAYIEHWGLGIANGECDRDTAVDPDIVADHDASVASHPRKVGRGLQPMSIAAAIGLEGGFANEHANEELDERPAAGKTVNNARATTWGTGTLNPRNARRIRRSAAAARWSESAAHRLNRLTWNLSPLLPAADVTVGGRHGHRCDQKGRFVKIRRCTPLRLDVCVDSFDLV